MLRGRPRGFFIVHETRQTAATHMADARADPFTLAAIFGYSDIQITAWYTLRRVKRNAERYPALMRRFNWWTRGTEPDLSGAAGPIFSFSLTVLLRAVSTSNTMMCTL